MIALLLQSFPLSLLQLGYYRMGVEDIRPCCMVLAPPPPISLCMNNKDVVAIRLQSLDVSTARTALMMPIAKKPPSALQRADVGTARIALMMPS